MFKKKSRLTFIVLCLVFCFFQFGFVVRNEADSKLSELRVFNRVVLLVKEQYVEPKRFDPPAMLLASLRAVEQKVPEVVIGEPVKDDISVQVGKKIRNFSIGGMTSLWDLSFRLRDIFRFIETDLPKSIPTTEIEYAAANGMLSKLDPHSIVLEPKYSKEMKLATRGEFGGLGVVIGLRDGFLTVISPLEGTPAAKAGLKALDKIIKINEDSTINLGLDEAVDQLRGKPGTSVMLTVERKGEAATRRIAVVRDIIKVDSVSSELLDTRYGYIKIMAFHGNTAQDMKVAIAQMEKKSKNNLAGLILDFRNNPGGLLDQSIAISDLFLDGGVVVITQGALEKNREEEKANVGPQKTRLPIVVLVNSGSASASEIVAGAIKNRGRGVVVGEQTFGKGSVQMLYDFPDKSSLKLTIAQYLTPGDESIQSVGITPDILLKPMYANDKKRILLFPEMRTREEDLESHLDDKRIIKRKPAYELAYLSKILEQSEEEQRQLSTKYREDYEISFAKKLLAQTKGSKKDDLLRAAAVVVGKERKIESQKLLYDLKKLDIDWSLPQNIPAKSTLSAKVVSPLTVKAGDILNINLEIKNTGNLPVFRVYGISDSPTPLFAGREFLFGKLMPGQKRLWNVEFKIPKEALSRQDLIRIQIKGNGDLALTNIDIPVIIEGLPRPVLAYTYYLDDTRLGNGDGFLEVGEQVDFVVLVKNIGSALAEEPWVLLKNLNGSELFMNEGRRKMVPLRPGETASERLSFTLKEEVLEAKVQLHLYDGVMGDSWSEKISLLVKKGLVKTNKLDGHVEILANRTALRATADDKGVVVAYLPAGLPVTLQASLGNFVRVRVSDNLSGFVHKNHTKIIPVIAGGLLKKTATQPTIVYRRTPPKINFAQGRAKPLVAKDSYKLSISIDSESAVRDVFLFVNEQKVYYKLFEAGQNQLNFDREIKLKPGVNIVTVVAREDDDYAQRESLTIFSEAGDPFIKEKMTRH